jgi:16S rRNA (uracil1498-N3)-methyltransferase
MNIFWSNDLSEGEIRLDGKDFHYIKNVRRIKSGESVKVFNGNGKIGFGSIREIQKKYALLDIDSVAFVERSEKPIELFLGTPKKEYFEEICRMATEAGVSRITPIKTEFSNWTYGPSQRLDSILESALIQSENPYLPIIEQSIDFKDWLTRAGDLQTIYFTTNEDFSSLGSECGKLQNIFRLLVGPEGGFSSSEEVQLSQTNNCIGLRLSGPILKAQTAVPLAIGFIKGLNY